MASWKTVSPAEAQEHPLYGLRGWLRIPSIGFVLLLLGAGLTLARGEGVPAWPWSAWEVLGGVIVLGVPASALLWFRRWRHFRPGYLVFAIVSGAWEIADVAQAAPRLRDPGGEIALMVLSFVLDAAFLVAMQRSRRFRVTFEHRVR